MFQNSTDFVLSISMFDDLGYCTRAEHGVLKIPPDELIIVKGSKIYGLYILEGSNVISHSSLTSGGFMNALRNF